jgi:tetratricopeptide (TPR) repeat protein
MSTPPTRSLTPTPGSMRPPIASNAPPGGSEPPRSGPTLPPAADLARKKSIVDRAKWIDQEDYFKVLMVSREASTEDVRAAFLRAAKVWHPDTLPASIADARAECEKVFRKITTAYETLVEPARRRAYERTLDAAARESAEAAQSLSQAEMHLTLGDREEAEELARKALVAAPGHPEATALLAFLEASDPRRRSAEHTSAQIRVLDMAIAKDPMCRRAHYFRAELHKRLENHEEAIRDLRVAVTNDPDDQQAQRELKIYEQKLREGIVQLRSLSPFPKKKEGFFDRILSKK